MNEKIQTKDGSITFKNKQYEETYHSVSGAHEEALKKFAEPCKVAQFAQKGEIMILDICFGLGYNTAAALDVVKESNPVCKVKVVGLENDPEIVHEMLKIDPKIFFSYEILQTIIKNKQPIMFNEIVVHTTPSFCFELIMGDARERVKLLVGKQFDAVFLDPFSPKKCPELWTQEFFKDIYSVMKPGAILATYSCARIVRDNLIAAGFDVKDGPVVGRNAPGTVAIKPQNPKV